MEAVVCSFKGIRVSKCLQSRKKKLRAKKKAQNSRFALKHVVLFLTLHFPALKILRNSNILEYVKPQPPSPTSLPHPLLLLLGHFLKIIHK